jgi:Tfp pilus assembly protein PilF
MSNKTLGEPATDVDLQEAQALLRRAGEHLGRDELSQAQQLLEQAVRLDPTNGGAYQDLGVINAKRGQLREGIACFRRALELTPDSPGLYANLGLACFHAGQIEESVSHLRKAIWLGASSADTHKNLARALTALPDPVGAEESYWAALRLKPDDAEAHYHLSLVMLAQGKYEQGWLEYEWRWRWRNKPKRRLDQPRWTGQKLDGKRVLILAESDTRDTIQFARYANLITEKGGRVALECQPSLTKLMRGCLGVEHIVPAGKPLPPHDFHVNLLSLPATMGTTFQTVPAARPYLGVASDILEHCREPLHDLGRPVGIALGGDSPSSKPEIPERVQLTLFGKLSQIPNICIVNLQDAMPIGAVASDGNGNHRLPTFAPAKTLYPMPDDPADKVVATAAALWNLGLLVTADNTIAHIAGALGIRTMLILPIAPDSRWLLHRDDTPWYPTVRLFRQRHRNDWAEVINRLADELTRELHSTFQR